MPWAFISLTLTSCIHSQSPTSPHYGTQGQNRENIAISISVGSLKSTNHKAFVRQLKNESGHKIKLLEDSSMLGLDRSIVHAGITDANLLIYLHAPESSDSEFSSISLHLVTSGELIDSVTYQRMRRASALKKTLDLLKRNRRTIREASPMDPIELVERLEQRSRCASVAEFISEYETQDIRIESEFTSRLIECRRRLFRRMEIPQEYLLHLVMRGVPEEQKQSIVDAIYALRLREDVFRVTRYLSDIVVDCKHECRAGELKLVVPFDDERYRLMLNQEKEALSPYHTLAKQLVQLAKNLAMNFSTRMIVEDSHGIGMNLEVSSIGGKVKLNPSPDLSQFLSGFKD